MLRIAVFIDGNNLFHVTKKLGFSIDYGKLSDFLERKFEKKGGDVVIQRFFTGAPEHPHEGQENFWKKLESVGYEVIKREIKRIRKEDSSIEEKADMDASIGYSIGESKDGFDLLVFIAGDSDYEILLKDLAKKGKKIVIISTTGIVSKELVKLTDPTHGNVQYIDLNGIKDDVLFHDNKKNGKGGAA